jgi:hypothetical protein
MPKRDLMERMLVRWGNQDHERLRAHDDRELTRLYLVLKRHMIVPDSDNGEDVRQVEIDALAS